MDGMENKTKQNEVPTKDAATGFILTQADAQEYYAYKKQCKIAQILSAFARSEGVLDGVEDVQRVMQRAARIRQAAIRVTPTQFALARDFLSREKLRVDCFIGGNGETLTRVKAYELRLMRKMGAGELTVAVTPSLLLTCRYAEIKKELIRLKRAARDSALKVWVENRYPFASIAKVGKIASEVGVKYFSVPYFAGCERLRYDLFGGCKLEVVGVDTLEDFKKMVGAGVGRIVTAYGFDMYTQWMKEAEAIKLPAIKTEKPLIEEKGEEKTGEAALKFV